MKVAANKKTESKRPPSRRPLVGAVQALPDEAWGYFVAWAAGQVIQFPDGLGGFTPGSRAGIEKLRAEAAAYLERAAGGSQPPQETS